jgi:hypothetical protein
MLLYPVYLYDTLDIIRICTVKKVLAFKGVRLYSKDTDRKMINVLRLINQ